MKRPPLRRVSTKRAAQMREYSKKRTAFLTGRPTCEKCGTRPSCDVHHKAGRSGTNYLDEATWAALCRQCHLTIHDRPGQARASGWIT